MQIKKTRAEKMIGAAEMFLCKKLVKEHKVKDEKAAKKLIEKQIVPNTRLDDKSPLKLNEIFYRFIVSAQNANMKKNVISQSLRKASDNKLSDPILKLRSLLLNFDPKKTYAKYGDDADHLLLHIIQELNPNGKINNNQRSLWPQYCKTVLSAAKYLSTFDSGKDFTSFVRSTKTDPRLRSAVPLIISEEVHGLGFTLACDALKELGFSEFGKPDVHVHDILTHFSFIEPKSSPYATHVVLCEIARLLGKTPFEIDKILWLVGSGKIRNEEQHDIKNSKKRFLKHH